MSNPGDRLNTNAVKTSFSYLLRRTAQRFKDANVPVLKQNGLSSLELTTMSLIQANDTCILRTLADAVGVEPPAMNRIINSLEDKHLASRNKSSKDARYTFFELTEAGAECLETTSAAVERTERGVLETLSECERREFLTYLQRFL